MRSSEKSLRAQLLEARSKLMRQIEILQTGREYLGRRPPKDALTLSLMETLKQINESIAELGPDDE